MSYCTPNLLTTWATTTLEAWTEVSGFNPLPPFLFLLLLNVNLQCTHFYVNSFYASAGLKQRAVQNKVNPRVRSLLFRILRPIQDFSLHGASKEPRNPLWKRILRFPWGAPWSERSLMNLSSIETQNPFSDSFAFKNPILDEETNAAYLIRQANINSHVR